MLRFSITKSIVLVILLAATLNLGRQFYRMNRESVESQELYEQYGVIACRLGPSVDERSRIYIELALIVAFLASRLKGFKGYALCGVSLLGVGMIYFFWWQYYFRLAKLAGSELIYIKHIAYLYQATVVDICIAASVTTFLLWQIGRGLVSVFETLTDEDS